MEKVLAVVDGDFRQVHASALPPWLLSVVQRPLSMNDRDRAFSDAGAEEIEHYGQRGESITVWRMEATWLVDWWDIDQHIAIILIDDPNDYIRFQAKWIAPMVAKILAESHRSCLSRYSLAE